MQRWVDVTEPDFGVAFLNDSKYGYDALGADIRLTLLRSPTYPWPDADQGEHRFRYALMIHDGDKDAVHQAAEDFNMPLRIVEGVANVDRPESTPQSALLAVSTDGIAVEAVKAAEDGSGVIIRLWETTGRHRATEINLASEFTAVAVVDLLEETVDKLALERGTLRLSFKPFEIISLKLGRNAT